MDIYGRAAFRDTYDDAWTFASELIRPRDNGAAVWKWRIPLAFNDELVIRINILSEQFAKVTAGRYVEIVYRGLYLSRTGSNLFPRLNSNN